VTFKIKRNFVKKKKKITNKTKKENKQKNSWCTSKAPKMGADFL